MKKILQITLFLGVLIEIFAIYKLTITSNVLYQKLLVSLAILFILIILKILTQLTENNHGN